MDRAIVSAAVQPLIVIVPPVPPAKFASVSLSRLAPAFESSKAGNPVTRERAIVPESVTTSASFPPAPMIVVPPSTPMEASTVQVAPESTFTRVKPMN